MNTIMNMNSSKIIWTLFICLLIAIPAVAVEPIESVDQFRGEGTTRTYLFIYDSQQFGKMESKYIGEDEFEGTDAYKFEERLTFDYSVLNNPLKISMISRNYVDRQGYYIGTDLNAAVDSSYQQLQIHRVDNSVIGTFNNDGNIRDINFDLGRVEYAIDNNMIDQLELFLAFKKIEVGDTISEMAFVPQVIQKALFRGTVDSFDGVLYGALVDSAYKINFTSPGIQTVYYTRDRKIIKVELETQNISIILSENPVDKLTPPAKALSLYDFIARLPFYAVYLLIGFIFAIPFLRSNYKKIEIYIALILGGLLFTLIGYTQVPLQKWYAEAYLIPGLKAGESLYILGINNALISGLIQETLKLILLAAIFIIRKPKLKQMVAIGLFAGIGFGIYEAGVLTGKALQSGAMTLWSWGLFERFFAMLFHAATGAILGYGLARGFKYTAIIWLMVALLHSFTNYLIVFLHRGVIGIDLFEIILAIIITIFALGVYFIVGRRRN